MIHLDVPQGTLEWFKARMGKPTASEFDKILTPGTLKLSKQSHGYLCRLVAEHVLQEPFQTETNVWAMDRGIELEQEAVEFYELTTGYATTPAGLCLTDDERIGASPDRFSGADGLLEIKCPLAHTHVGYLLAGELPVEYLLQIYGQLYVTGKQWVDFLSYFPGLPAVLLRIAPDPKIQDALHSALTLFLDQLTEAKRRLEEMRQ